jgi:hypothetical protein
MSVIKPQSRLALAPLALAEQGLPSVRRQQERHESMPELDR